MPVAKTLLTSIRPRNLYRLTKKNEGEYNLLLKTSISRVADRARSMLIGEVRLTALQRVLNRESSSLTDRNDPTHRKVRGPFNRKRTFSH